MNVDKENILPKRKPTRLKDFDYSSPGAYFITICTENRRKILSRIVGGDVLDAAKNVELLPWGKIADKYINQLNDFYENITVDRYVIMPNHIYIMLFVSGNGGVEDVAPYKTTFGGITICLNIQTILQQRMRRKPLATLF